MTKDMTTGSIPPLLVNFTIPLVLGNLFQLTYNAVDSIIVGKFVGEDALAAVTRADAVRAAQKVLASDAIPASLSAGAALHAAAQLIANGTSRSALAIFSGRQNII